MISELTARTFAARDIAHREHLKSRSYATHMALGAFYGDVISAIDSVVENYQGMFDTRIKQFEVKTKPVNDIEQYLTDEMDWIESNLEELSNNSPSISNLIQNLISVYSECIYKLSLK